MDDGERRSVRQAAENVEQAHFTVTELLATAHQGIIQSRPDMHVTPKEVAALREIDSDLRQACDRLWSLCDEERA